MNGDQIREKYFANIKEEGPVEGALRMTMADYMYLATFDTEEQARNYVKDVFEEVQE